MRSWAIGSMPMTAGAATWSIAAATISSSVMAVKPVPTRPVSVSRRTSTQDRLVRLEVAPASSVISRFRGMARQSVIFMG